MKIIFPVALFLLLGYSQGFSQSSGDSVVVDKQKVEGIVKKLKKRQKAVPSDVSYSFPSKINKGETLALCVIHKGETILIYDIDTVTYEIGTVTDLR